MMAEGTRERDLVLAPNEFAFISDQTKGNINVYVGPYKTSLANTDQPVYFNEQNKRFERCSLEISTQIFATAPEGWYLVLKNPALEGNQPTTGTVSNLPQLQVGHKVNTPGPVSFALWPGQMTRVLRGHHLRSNQYLVVRVYDEESARQNWSKAVIKPQTGNAEELPPEPELDLTMGNHLVIRGTDISFYIPPTGIEVVPDSQGKYIRDAVTLERLEYCILLDEDGNKRFIQGPDVVFPKPTETFVDRHNHRKFKAIELNENSGLYVKVIAPYTEEDSAYKVGDELFITGKEQMIYFPRPEHAIVKYGEQEIHYAVAIPAGEGRYVLERMTGQIQLKKGPMMYLPDPRKEVIVRRVLDPRQVQLWYPGNQDALAHNLKLKALLNPGENEGYLTDNHLKKRQAKSRHLDAPQAPESQEFAGDDFTRKTSYTPPRTITLDTRYDGAVSVAVWTGYAVLVVSKTSERKVMVGPQTCLLEYDQTLEPMTLSTGTPKSDESLLKTVYLRVLHNKVSDKVVVETQDLCNVELELSYRVNFEGDPERWFNVENYVKFLTEHLRSLLRNAVKQMSIDLFYSQSISIIRDTILGQANEAGQRPGRLFEENGMRVYDIEVLNVSIQDTSISEKLIEAQRDVVEKNLSMAAHRRRLDFLEEHENIKRQIAQTQSETRKAEVGLQIQESEQALLLKLKHLETDIVHSRKSLEAKEAEQELVGQIHEAELARKQQSAEQELRLAKERLDHELLKLRSEVEAVAQKAEAITPEFIAALQSFSDHALAEKMAESMAPLAILGGKSVADVFSNLLKGTQLEHVIAQSLPLKTRPS